MEDEEAFVSVHDRRDKGVNVKIHTVGLSFGNFKERVREELKIKKEDNFVITTTNRKEIKDDKTWGDIDKGDTLYVLKEINQELFVPVKERIDFVPHYDTIVKGGLYEYYASNGQNPLAYAFAELIDNALSATKDNIGPRNIDILLHLKPPNHAIFIIDNGRGMTSEQLNNWAIYRLSKFKRKDKRGSVTEGEEDDKLVEQKQATRFLNSNISYFGVGGKQAVFFIGDSTRMITKSKEAQDVHELTLSKEEFEQKEINKEPVYSSYILNRKVGDASHIPSKNEVLRSIINEEENKESFTVVEIGGIRKSHVSYLEKDLEVWTRQLAHTYHYYIHGKEGNHQNTSSSDINIRVKLFKGIECLKEEINLRDIEDDMQSQYIRDSRSQFLFKAETEGSGVVDGIIRYHPFLYDSETYPSDINDPRVEPDSDEHDHDVNVKPARGRRPIFECYWNGRLIPYTSIEEFDWCSEPKKSRTIATEWWNRISGVLFTNDRFQVTTNKLTFTDLANRLQDKSTTFSKVINGQGKRTSIKKEFQNWLTECHQQHDKQFFFTEYWGQIVRGDRQTPWAQYGSVEWENKTFKVGQMVKIGRKKPELLGTIKKIYLYGEQKGDTYAAGGEIEIQQEPQSLYNKVQVVPLSRLDRQCSEEKVKELFEEEELKLPAELIVNWLEVDRVEHNEKRPVRKPIGAMRIEIKDRNGKIIHQLPGNAPASHRKLKVELKVLHRPDEEATILELTSEHVNSGYYFKKIESITNLGAHTLQLQVVLSESGSTIYSGKNLPSHRIDFNVTGADPKKFTVQDLDDKVRIGKPFFIPLVFKDNFNNITEPPHSVTPTIESRDIDISYENSTVKGNELIMKGIVAKGIVNEKRKYNATIRVPGLQKNYAAQDLSLTIVPGLPKELRVKPEEELTIVNRTAPGFEVEVVDMSGNIVINTKDLIVTCKYTGLSDTLMHEVDCSYTGCGKTTGDPILRKNKDPHKITAKFEIPSMKEVAAVERTVVITPSNSISHIEIKQEENKLEKGESIMRKAGEVITGLTFSLYDEAGRIVNITDKISPKIKVNWTPELEQRMILSGKLPSIKVPSSVTDVNYCQVAIHDESYVEFSFTVNAVPAEPNQIKCKCQGDAVVQIGEVLNQDIQITVKDKFGNKITDLPKNSAHEVQVTGDGLQEQLVKVSSNKSGFVVSHVQFERDKIGFKDLNVTWRGLRDFVQIKIAAPPETLSQPGCDSDTGKDVPSKRSKDTVTSDRSIPKADKPTRKRGMETGEDVPSKRSKDTVTSDRSIAGTPATKQQEGPRERPSIGLGDETVSSVSKSKELQTEPDHLSNAKESLGEGPRCGSKATMEDLDRLNVFYEKDPMEMNAFFKMIKSKDKHSENRTQQRIAEIMEDFKQITEEQLKEFRINLDDLTKTEEQNLKDSEQKEINNITTSAVEIHHYFKKTVEEKKYSDTIIRLLTQWTTAVTEFMQNCADVVHSILHPELLPRLLPSDKEKKEKPCEILYHNLFLSFSRIFLLRPRQQKKAQEKIGKKIMVCVSDICFLQSLIQPITDIPKLVFVCEVKRKEPSKGKSERKPKWIENKIKSKDMAQIGMELLCESTGSFFSPSVAGIACFRSEIMFLLLDISKDHLQAIKDDASLDEKHAEIYYTETYDILKPEDRSQVMDILLYFAAIQSCNFIYPL